MRVHVDWTRCDGHGSCAELLPELLDTDDWGFPLVGATARPGRPGCAGEAGPACREGLSTAGPAHGRA